MAVYGAVSFSALAGFQSILSLRKQKTIGCAGEIKELKQKRLPFGKMMNVQAITKIKREILCGREFSTLYST
ncbi:MAG: hypothetical protein ABF904_14990 [Ethanoligenens sp.]